MNKCTFGQHYFAIRGQLTEVIRGIDGLAAETNTQLANQSDLTQTLADLSLPFLFVVCGEVNAGKSALINGLFGTDLCTVSPIPETRRVHWYLHGDTNRDTTISPMLEQCFRPLGFLRDFHVADTPGTNAPDTGNEEITSRLVPAADLILCVLPISNPWGASTWNFISSLPAETLDRLAIVIQMADQRDDADIQVILGHVSDLAVKRTDRQLPVFAVSAKLACDAKLSDPIDTRLLKSSGFTALEDFISKQICLSPPRCKALEEVRKHTAAALRSVEDRIEEQTRGIDTQYRFLDEVGREIDEMRQTFLTRLPVHLAGVAEVFQCEAVGISNHLRRKLRAFPSMIRLFSGDRTGPEMETFFIEQLQSAVEAVALTDGTEVADACQSHWNDLGKRARDVMGIDLGEAAPVAETLVAAKDRFVSRLGSAAREGVGNLKVRNQLDKDLRRRNLALKSFVFMTLVLTTAGATCGALHIPWAPLILISLAAVFLTGGILSAWITRKSITNGFQERLLDTCGAFASTLHEDYDEALRIVFRDYADTLAAMRTHVAREKLAIEPRLRRWQELFLTLKTIEQDL